MRFTSSPIRKYGTDPMLAEWIGLSLRLPPSRLVHEARSHTRRRGDPVWRCAFAMTLAILRHGSDGVRGPVLAFSRPAAGGSAGAIHDKARLAPMGRSPTYRRPAMRAREPVPILYADYLAHSTSALP